jgi:hypothetical protein
MQARLIQLAARYIGLGCMYLLAKLGIEYSDGQIASIVDPVMAGAGVLVTIIVDHYLHKLQAKADKTK